MHIVFPLVSFHLSGGARLTLQYANGLAEIGHQVTFVCPENTLSSYFPIDPRIQVLRVSSIITPRFGGYLRLIWILGRTIPSCDIIIANSWQAMYPSMIAAFFKRRHIFFLVQSDYILSDCRMGSKNIFAQMRTYIMIKLAFKIHAEGIAVSKWVRSQTLIRHGRTMYVIANGVDGKIFSLGSNSIPDIKQLKRVLVMGRSAPAKGYSDALSAIRLARKKDPTIKMLLVSTETLTIPADIPSEYVNPENDTDLVSCYRRSSVLLYTSHLEGFGFPPLEAMACGVPIVSYDCGGITEYAENMHNCILVQNNAYSSLAESMLLVLTDQPLREKLIKGGLETAKKYSLEKTMNQFCSFIESKSLHTSDTK